MATTSLQAHATQLLNRSDRWARGVRKSDGLAFVLFTGSKKQTYMASEFACTCPGYRYRGRCAHVDAVRFEAIAARTRAFQAKKRYEDLFGSDELEDSF